MLLAKMGYPVGISSGANFAACLKIKEKKVATVFPDNVYRYLLNNLLR